MTRTLIASAFLMFASAASASNPVVFHYGDPPTARVSTRDVDVRSAMGRMTVERRIQLAAQQVCADAEDSSPLAQPRRRFIDCYNLAMSSGVSQLELLAAE